MRQLGIAMLLAVSLGSAAQAQADSTVQGCNSPLPVLTHELDDGSGPWQLPVSADRPDTLTQARIAFALVPPSGDHKLWSLQITVTFADPKPLGIPYSFEKLSLDWLSPSGATSALLDWTDACTQVGKALFPGQSWTQSWEIPGTDGLSELERPSVSLWGGRV